MQLALLGARHVGKGPLGGGIAAGNHPRMDAAPSRRQFEPQGTPVSGIRYALQVAKLFKLVEQTGQRARVVVEDAREFTRRHRPVFTEPLQREELAEVEIYPRFTQRLLNTEHDLTADLADQSAQPERGISMGGGVLHAADDIAAALFVKAIISEATF